MPLDCGNKLSNCTGLHSLAREAYVSWGHLHNVGRGSICTCVWGAYAPLNLALGNLSVRRLLVPITGCMQLPANYLYLTCIFYMKFARSGPFVQHDVE